MAYRLAMPLRRFIRVNPDMSRVENPLAQSDFTDELRNLPVDVNIFHVPYDLVTNPNWIKDVHKPETKRMLDKRWHDYVREHSEVDAINIIYSEGDNSSPGPLWMLHDVFHHYMETRKLFRTFYAELRKSIILDVGNDRLVSKGKKSYFQQTDFLMYCLPEELRRQLPSSSDKIGTTGDNFDLFADVLVLYVIDRGIPSPNVLKYPGGIFEWDDRDGKKKIVRVPKPEHSTLPNYKEYEVSDPDLKHTTAFWNDWKIRVYTEITDVLKSLVGCVIFGSRIPNPAPAKAKGKSDSELTEEDVGRGNMRAETPYPFLLDLKE